MGEVVEVARLLDLPFTALEAVADALLSQADGEDGVLHPLRSTCRPLRAAANARTRRLRIQLDDGLEAAVGCRWRFPATTSVTFCSVADGSSSGPLEQLAACLAALPDACWPTVEVVDEAYSNGTAARRLPAAVALQAARLCPRLRKLGCYTCYDEDDDSAGAAAGAELAAALEALEGAAGTLEELLVDMRHEQFGRGDAQRCAAALGKLGGLRALSVTWAICGPPDARELLSTALPSLTALSSLAVDCGSRDFRPSPQLGLRPAALQELELQCMNGSWLLDALRAAPELVSLTKLKLSGCPDEAGGGLALVSAKCRALRQLDLTSIHLDQPPAPLAHLTFLSIQDCCGAGAAPLANLAAAAPALEALYWAGEDGDDHGLPEAAAGHPSLERLAINICPDDDPEPGAEEAWLRAERQLPALTSLTFSLRDNAFGGEELGGGGGEDSGGTARLLRLCEWLRPCERLADLSLAVVEGTPAAEALAAVGAAIGDRLETLELGRAALPTTRDAAATTLFVLAGCYPSLEELTLQLDAPDGMNAAAAGAIAQGVLFAAEALAPLCPSLEAVHVESSPTSECEFERASWLRPSQDDEGSEPIDEEEGS